jgi:hypothetical protein
MNVIGGHVICTVIGLAALHWIGPQPWVLALATQRASRAAARRARIALAGPERIAGRIGQHAKESSGAIGADVDENFGLVGAFFGAVDFRASRTAEDEIACSRSSIAG